MNRRFVPKVVLSSQYSRVRRAGTKRFHKKLQKRSPGVYNNKKKAIPKALSPLERLTRAHEDYALAKERFAKLSPRIFSCGPKEYSLWDEQLLKCSQPVLALGRSTRRRPFKKVVLRIKSRIFFRNLRRLVACKQLWQKFLMGLYLYYAIKAFILATNPKSFRRFIFRGDFVRVFVSDYLTNNYHWNFYQRHFMHRALRKDFIHGMVKAIVANPSFFSARRQRWKGKKSPRDDLR